MQTEISKDESAWIARIWTWMHSEVRAGERVFVPAGGTPTPMYRHWVTQASAHLRSLKFVQIDDVLTGPERGTFKQFFAREMTPFLDQFEWIENADREADVAILGVGVNGHVAFHEPGFPRQFYSGCLPLSEETMIYLGLTQPTWGITYGVASFLKCKKILVLARGERKKKILHQAATDNSLPISWILTHPNVTLLTDF